MALESPTLATYMVSPKKMMVMAVVPLSVSSIALLACICQPASGREAHRSCAQHTNPPHTEGEPFTHLLVQLHKAAHDATPDLLLGLLALQVLPKLLHQLQPETEITKQVGAGGTSANTHHFAVPQSLLNRTQPPHQVARELSTQVPLAAMPIEDGEESAVGVPHEVPAH